MSTSSSGLTLRKRLVVCVDGHDSSGRRGARGPMTTVYNLLACVKEGQVSDQNGQPCVQERHYESGVKEQGTTVRFRVARSGDGYKQLVEKVYRRCCELNEHDEVWLFGSGCGAAVIRAVAGLLHWIRRLRSGTNDFHQNYQKALKVCAAVQGKGELGAGQINRLLRIDALPAPSITFVGVFDTVKAFGDKHPYDTSLNDSIWHLRHAVALHEDRRDLAPEYILPDEDTLSRSHSTGRTFVQAWFVGSHDDICGSSAHAGLSLYPLQWMLLETSRLGLALAFHGNAPNAPAIDDPLKLVFPPDEASAPVGTIIHPSVYSLIDENVTVVMETRHTQLVQDLSEWSGTMLGEVDHTIDDGDTTVKKRIPNPGFWSRLAYKEVDVESLPPLRILVCGYPGGLVSERRSGVHNVHEEIRIEGRDDVVLHDSKGFEGGSVQELEDVKMFIRRRATEPELADRLHVIWFCLEANATRTTQIASQAIFETLHDCRGDVPVVLVVTKKDQFLNMRVGERMNELMSGDGETTPEQFAESRRYAQEELEKRARLMVDEIMALEGGRVDAWVCTSRNDDKSISLLTERSSAVFKDEATRLMYVKAQMTRPDLKMNMAIFMTMRRYRHAVGAATTGGMFPLLPTLTRQGMRDDISRRIVACFGIKELQADEALKVLKDHLPESAAVRDIKTYWGEALAALSIGSFGMAAPFTVPGAAALLVPHMAQLFLCTAADLILVLAIAFQTASFSGRLQPAIKDVETAAVAVKDHMEPLIHRAVVDLIPTKSPLATFKYGHIQAKMQSLLETCWRELANDTAFARDTAVLRQASSAGARLQRTYAELDANRPVAELGGKTVGPELE